MLQGLFHKRDGLLDWYNNTGSAVVCGQIVVVGTVVGVVQGLQGIANNDWGTLAIDGHVDIVKATGAINRGDAVYWNATGNPVSGTAGTGALTTTASGNTLVGFCEIAALSGDAVARCVLTSAQRTTTIAGSVTADDVTGSDSSLGVVGAPPATTSSAGGTVAIAGGIGGSVSGAGGAVTATGGAGTAASSTGGAVTVTGGAGGAAGTGGAVTLVGGSPASGNAAGGAGTASGGAGSGTGAGGTMTTKGGASGSGATGNGGAWSGGGGAALSTNGTGGAASLTGGVATGTGTGGALTLTAGASAGASGTAGAASLDAGAAAGGTGAAITIGDANAIATYLNRGPLKPPIIGQTLTALGTTQNSTPTAAQLLGGITTQTGQTGAGTYTLPSGTTLSSACARTPVAGDSFDHTFANLGGGQTITITGATGTTVIGTAAVGSGKVARMTFVNTGTNTWNIYVVVSA